MDIFEQLKAPFPAHAVHWRVGATNAKKLGVKPWEATKGIALAYIDARDVMERLDEVVGAGNWQCRYPLASGSLLICEIGIRMPPSYVERNDGAIERATPLHEDWIWKANGAGETDIEADKGRCSDAFKRAGVLLGIGRYLYNLPNAWHDLKNGKFVQEPRLPNWALPEGDKAERAPTKKAAAVKNTLATDKQFAEINAFVKKKQIPPRTLEWCKDEKNWEGMTSKQADNIIGICKEHKS